MTEPTDPELLAECDRVSHIADAGQRRLACLRAALAKWGTPPAVAGEPVAWRYVASKVWGEFVYTEDPKRAQHARDNGIDVQPVFTAPHPTQAQAVNQDDRPFIVRLAEDFAEECVTAGYVTTKAASYGRLMDEALSTQAQAGAELAEADRRAGAAERELASCREDVARFTRLRDKMKEQWGVDRNVSFDAVWDEALKLKKQAGAEPLTDEQIRAMCKESWVFETVKQWVRITEQHHGIKGGQHGTE